MDQAFLGNVAYEKICLKNYKTKTKNMSSYRWYALFHSTHKDQQSGLNGETTTNKCITNTSFVSLLCCCDIICILSVGQM